MDTPCYLISIKSYDGWDILTYFPFTKAIERPKRPIITTKYLLSQHSLRPTNHKFAVTYSQFVVRIGQIWSRLRAMVDGTY